MILPPINDFKITLEIISPLVLIYASLRALWQLQLMKEQSTITRESLAITELREFVDFLGSFESLNESIKLKNTANIDFGMSEMQNFDLAESSDPKFKKNISNWHKFYKNNGDIYIQLTSCSNKLEVIATALNKGTARIDVIEESIAPVFCNFVEQHPYVYIKNRNKALTLYKNTIALYRRFKPKVRTIQQQIDLIKSEVDELINRP